MQRVSIRASKFSSGFTNIKALKFKKNLKKKKKRKHLNYVAKDGGKTHDT